MLTIKDSVSDEIVINKSRFICYLYQTINLEEINNYLKEVKDKYSDASHICYAYILENNQKMNDDNEPSGTAGIPILTVLKKHNLTNVLAIVIRYFGGIKLGSGGLIRAYSGITVNTLEKTDTKELIKGYLVNITFDYSKEKLITTIIDNNCITNKIYDENINYTVKLNNDILNKLNELKIDYNIINEIYL